LYLIRQSIGGAGYSAWSGMQEIIQEYSPDVTFEGDNTVMAQQAFNYLKKLLKKLKNGPINDQGFFDYMNEMNELSSMNC
jgi:acyl-CoA oxidase